MKKVEFAKSADELVLTHRRTFVMSGAILGDRTKFLAIAVFSVQEMIGSYARFIPVKLLQKRRSTAATTNLQPVPLSVTPSTAQKIVGVAELGEAKTLLLN